MARLIRQQHSSAQAPVRKDKFLNGTTDRLERSVGVCDQRATVRYSDAPCGAFQQLNCCRQGLPVPPLIVRVHDEIDPAEGLNQLLGTITTGHGRILSTLNRAGGDSDQHSARTVTICDQLTEPRAGEHVPAALHIAAREEQHVSRLQELTILLRKRRAHPVRPASHDPLHGCRKNGMRLGRIAVGGTYVGHIRVRIAAGLAH